jgi:DNA-binding MarR family transcriptional regulator
MMNDTIYQTTDLVVGVTTRLVQFLVFLMKEEKQLPIAQYRVLRILSKYPTSLSKLSRLLEITKASLSDTVNILMEKGMLEKTRDKGDGRVFILSATPAGVAQVERFERRMRVIVRKYLEKMDGQDIQPIHDGLALLDQYLLRVGRNLDLPE